MSCFLLPPCLHKAVSLQSLADLFVMALWKAQAGKMWGNFRLCVLTLCSNVCFAWTVGLSLGALCGCPQWGSIVQMWAAETRPEGWLRVGPVPSSNLEPPGGCEAAFSAFFLPTYLSCTPRLSSTEVFELLMPWYQWELCAYTGNR